jgi:hypothetical protein
MAYEKPLPAIDDDNRLYWEGAKRHELTITYCKHCAGYFFPPRQLCPDCLRDDGVEWRKASGKGTVYSISVVHQNRAKGFREDVPYTVGYITLEEGIQMLCNVVAEDPYDVKVGMPVEVFFEDASEGISIPRFRLV